jgi:hypothetical protein
MTLIAPLTASHRHGERVRSNPRSLAAPTLVALIALSLLGVAKGANSYAHRSPVVETHVPGTNAIVPHVCIAAGFLLLTIFVELRRRHRSRPSPWTAPFLRHAWSRLRTNFTGLTASSASTLRPPYCTSPFEGCGDLTATYPGDQRDTASGDWRASAAP